MKYRDCQLMKTNKKDTHQRIVPALRFPEFQNAGEWESTDLGTITYKTNKRNKTGESLPIYSINNKQGFIKQEDQFDGIDSSSRGYDLSLYNLVDKHTFAYNPARINVGSIGYSGELNNIIISSLYVCFKTRESVIDDFLLKYFDSDLFNKAVVNSVEGGIRSYLFYDNFAKINLYLPPTRNEQQKIADCLSSIDSLIKATEDKIALLKAHKKGLMQQLFPAEGETTPKLRFPEFQNCGSWCSYKLKDFGAFFRGLTYSTTDVSNDNKGMGVLRSTNIQDNRLILDRDIVFVNKTCSSEQQLKKGDIVICMSNGSKTLVGKNAELDQDLSYVLTIGAFCSIFRPKNSFAKYLLQTDSYTNFISLAIGGGNINNLKNSDLENFILFAPIKRAEQQKIADCLSSIDSLIKATEDKVAHLKAHKRGLIQQLFPNIDKY